MSIIKERIHISIPIETSRFLRIVAALSHREMSEIVAVSLEILKHFINATSSTDEFLYYIENKDPALVEKLVAIRNTINENKIAEVVEA